MGNPYKRLWDADKFLPFYKYARAYTGFSNIGVAVNFTATVNTGLVQVVVHSLGRIPSQFYVQERLPASLATGYGIGLISVKASVSDNSCVRIVSRNYSSTDPLSAAATLICFQ